MLDVEAKLIIRTTTEYNKRIKKLTKYSYEMNKLINIIHYIDDTYDYKELCSNTLASFYDFERLRYKLTNYYSFNLGKAHAGTIRLIITFSEDKKIVILVTISFKHYKDIKIGDD